MFRWFRKIALVILASILTNCAALDGYERKYSLAYYDEQGHKIESSVSLVPVKPVHKIEPTK